MLEGGGRSQRTDARTYGDEAYFVDEGTHQKTISRSGFQVPVAARSENFVFLRAHAGKTSQSSIVFGTYQEPIQRHSNHQSISGHGSLPSLRNRSQHSSMPFDNVYSSAHAGKDTRSQITLSNFGGDSKDTIQTAMPFDNVYSSAHNGKDTRSSVNLPGSGAQTSSSPKPNSNPFSPDTDPMPKASFPMRASSYRYPDDTARNVLTYQEPSRGNSGQRLFGGQGTLPSLSSQSQHSSMPFDNVYSSAHVGKDTRSQITLSNFGGDSKDTIQTAMPFDNVYSSAHNGKDTRSSVNLPGPGAQTSSSLTKPYSYPLAPNTGPMPRVSPLKTRRLDQAIASDPSILSNAAPPDKSEYKSEREKYLEQRVTKLEQQVAYLLELNDQIMNRR